jgi:flagellum-specific peptidoglycan hydrolase FlgJ
LAHPASITLAVDCRSAWGSAVPQQPFGIKATETQPAVESATFEVVDGKVINTTARFRRFDSLSQAFDLHGQLLATASPYQTAMTLVQDPDRFADALTGVYATDPQYGTTLRWVMDNYGLKQHDLGGPGGR